MDSARLDSESVEGASKHAQQIVRNHVVALALSRLGADPIDAERAVLDYIASLESKVAQAGQQRETDRLLWDSSIKGAWAALKDAQSERDEARAALSSEREKAAAWRDYAEHVEKCPRCGEIDWSDCWEGRGLRGIATRLDSTGTGETTPNA